MTMYNRLMCVVSCLLIAALLTTMIPTYLFPSPARAEEENAVSQTACEYDVAVGDGCIRHHADDTWEIIAPLPDGLDSIVTDGEGCAALNRYFSTEDLNDIGRILYERGRLAYQYAG